MNNKKLEDIKQKVNDSAGKISTVHYKKDLDPKKTIVKKHGEIGKITKLSVFQVRVGVDYENIKTVKEAHESGERKRRGLPSTMEKIQKGIYHHLVKGNYYIGCAPVDNKYSINQTDYFIDGEPVGLGDIVVTTEDSGGLTLGDILYAGDTKGHNSEWVQLDWDNIVSLSSIK
jgi:hypothetical protein